MISMKKMKLKKIDEDDNRINIMPNLLLIPKKNIKENESVKKRDNIFLKEKINLKSKVIWIDKNIDNEENIKFMKNLASISELKLFKDVNSAMHYMQTLRFEETKVIISGNFYKEFLEK